eukprot:TRINITY_DN5210_c0_g3_i1.p1 TRINITY_DN5210_c0_g3~~TRINITY_DN5210_c0_g3_i1.p1  ORF type:complete len:789 (+),score=112.15 TRINITY_DN5210_c0_g3_i1:148-2514(+)
MQLQQALWLCVLVVPIVCSSKLSDTGLITNCDGMVRLAPNEDYTTNIMFEKLPQLYNDYLASIARELKLNCGITRTDEEWDRLVYERYDIFSALLTPTRTNITEFVDLCPNGAPFPHTRDLTGVIRSIMGNSRVVLPETCTFDSWINNGSCSIAATVPEVERTVMTLSARKCPDRGNVKNNYFEIAIACRGINCQTFLQPCNDTSHCGSKESCVSDLMAYSSTVKDLLYWVFEELRVYTGSGEQSSCTTPNRFFELLFHRLYYSSGICLPSESTKASIKDITQIFNLTNLTNLRKDVFAGCTHITSSICNLHTLVLNWTATLTYNAWKVFPYYDSLTAAISVFDHDSDWVEWPTLSMPTEDTHILSTDCSGLVYGFLGSPYAFMFYSPRMPAVLQTFAEFSLEVWKCERIFQQLDYITAQALWRIEPYLKMFTDPSVSKRFPSPSLYEDVFPTRGNYKILNLSLGDWYFKKSLSGVISAGDSEYQLILKASSEGESCLEHSFMNMHLTCRGARCDDFLLRNICNSPSDCDDASECLCFEDVYESRPVATSLWAMPHPFESNGVTSQDYLEYFKCPNLKEGDDSMVNGVDDSAWRSSVYEIWKGLNNAELCSERVNCTGSCEMRDGVCVQRSKGLKLPKGGADTNDLWFCYPQIPNDELTWSDQKVTIKMTDYKVVEYTLSDPRYVYDTPVPVLTAEPSPPTAFRYVTDHGSSFEIKKVVTAILICVLLIGGTIACLSTILARKKGDNKESDEEKEELAEEQPNTFDDSSKQGTCYPDEDDDDDTNVPL